METDFLASGSFFSDFSDTPASEKYFLSSGNVFLNKFFIPYGGDGFSGENLFFLFNLFFYNWKSSLKLMETNFFGKIFHPVETVFFSFLQVETVTETS